MTSKDVVIELLSVRDYVVSSEDFVFRAAALEKIETLIEIITEEEINFSIKRWYE